MLGPSDPSVNRQRFPDRLANLGFTNYEEYFASDFWLAAKRRYAASGRPRRCAVCGSSPVQLHHHNYANLGAEPPEDFTPLCRDHHVEVHKELKARRWSVSLTDRVVRLLRGEKMVPKPAAGKKKKKSQKRAERRREQTAVREVKQKKLSEDRRAQLAKRAAIAHQFVRVTSLIAAINSARGKQFTAHFRATANQCKQGPPEGLPPLITKLEEELAKIKAEQARRRAAKIRAKSEAKDRAGRASASWRRSAGFHGGSIYELAKWHKGQKQSGEALPGEVAFTPPARPI